MRQPSSRLSASVAALPCSPAWKEKKKYYKECYPNFSEPKKYFVSQKSLAGHICCFNVPGKEILHKGPLTLAMLIGHSQA